MLPKILRNNVFLARGVLQTGVWGQSPQPLGEFWLFLAKITLFGVIFDEIHQQIVTRLSINIQNFDLF